MHCERPCPHGLKNQVILPKQSSLLGVFARSGASLAGCQQQILFKSDRLLGLI